MENFVVSARKYRPDTFQTVVAQASVRITLKNAIKSSQLAHAYLFCGPRCREGIIVFVLGFVMLYLTRETFHTDLDYIEA